MWDRLKNIVRTNVNSFLDGNGDDFDSKEYERLNQEYERLFDKKKQEQNAPSQNPLEAQHYATLHIPYGSSYEQVKDAYKMLIKKHHPDKHQHDPTKHKQALETTQKLNIAYAYFKQKFENKA